MGFFGYYAWHTFVNQLRKLFKTWVLVFMLVCCLFGAVIGVGAAMLDETIEEQQTTEIVPEATEPEAPPEEEASPSLSGSAILELVAGGVVLALFFFEAISADKNGSKIFQPADVNLLFPSPMKPQSVLMFRLATQLGTAVFASIYMLFQLPNLILNFGMSPWGAVAILITWFASVLIGKLIQVLLYTVCSTNLRFKAYLRKGVYAIAAVLAGSFLLFYKAGGLGLAEAADRFFNAPFTRWIPFWGWLKGLTVFVDQQRWPEALVCLALLALGSAAMVYGIWHLNADFYEDAMAKSEETAALLQKAQSEKTSGTAVTRQRKKDRKESLTRDAMRHGWGESVFFHKTLYNRFRFAHFGVFTKTMETYLVAAVGISAALRFFFNSLDPTPVVLSLGALVFFRALGNPLAEDTGMDFFRMIPGSTWKKLLFSLLGGTVNTLLDLILPMLAASILLPANPLKLLVWLPLILSVDFYSTSVVTFIDLSVPASIGKTIKQLVEIMFIYFGLLPDIGILAFGIVLGHTFPAAAASTVLNLGLGVLAFSLASVFLQPKGKDVTEAVTAQDLRAAKKNFSRLGLAVSAILVIVSALQIFLLVLVQTCFPAVLESSWGIWLLTFAPQYLIGMPIGLLLMRAVPAVPPQRQALGASRGVKFLFISVFMMYCGNLLGNLITTLIGLGLHSQVVNPLEAYIGTESALAQTLFLVILAPLFEEYIFRKQLIDRMAPYGGKTAVLLSALLFGLFHGNLSQFFYAFGLGLVFGYIYLNTGKLRCTVIAHMCINFMGSVVAPALIQHLPLEALEGGTPSISQLLSPWTLGYIGYLAFLIIGALTGLVLLCMNARRLRFPQGALELPRSARFRVTCCNTGMVLTLILSLFLILASLVGQ